jgi:hypothetical protein
VQIYTSIDEEDDRSLCDAKKSLKSTRCLSKSDRLYSVLHIYVYDIAQDTVLLLRARSIAVLASCIKIEVTLFTVGKFEVKYLPRSTRKTPLPPLKHCKLVDAHTERACEEQLLSIKWIVGG